MGHRWGLTMVGVLCACGGGLVVDGVDDGVEEGRALGAAHADDLWRDGHVLLRGVLKDPFDAASAVLAAGREVLTRCSRCASGDDIFDEQCRGCHR